MTRHSALLPVLLLASLAAACASPATPIVDDSPPSETPAAAEVTLVPTNQPTPTNPPETASTEPVFVGAGGQYATDPSTVDLASGRPTLVKFFAFW